MEPQIQQSMQELGRLLSKVKGAGQVSLSQPSQRSNIQQESDMVLGPLMDLLDGRWAGFSLAYSFSWLVLPAQVGLLLCECL